MKNKYELSIFYSLCGMANATLRYGKKILDSTQSILIYREIKFDELFTC